MRFRPVFIWLVQTVTCCDRVSARGPPLKELSTPHSALNYPSIWLSQGVSCCDRRRAEVLVLQNSALRTPHSALTYLGIWLAQGGIFCPSKGNQLNNKGTK